MPAPEGACTLAQCLNRRRRTRRFNPVANHPVERRNLCAREAVARIVLGGEPVLADRGVELIFLLEVARLLEVRPRRGEHRALERDPELGVVRRRLDGPPISRNGFVQIAGAGGRVTLPVRLPGGASRRQHRQPHQECKSLQPSRHRCSQSELRACGKPDSQRQITTGVKITHEGHKDTKDAEENRMVVVSEASNVDFFSCW